MADEIDNGTSMQGPRETQAEFQVAKKRVARLEVLKRMIGEFHAKHGRFDSVSHISQATTPDKRHGRKQDNCQGQHPQDYDSAAHFSPRTGPEQHSSKVSKKKMDVLPPVIHPTEGTPGKIEAAAKGSSSTLLPLPHNKASYLDRFDSQDVCSTRPVIVVCACCGNKGGTGHGRLCLHSRKMCGFCRIEEAKNVLYGHDTERRRGSRGTRREGSKLVRPSLQ